MANNAKQFRRVQSTDTTINLIQDQLQDLFKTILTNPWAFGRPIYQVPFVVGMNVVQHGLGRNFVSCFCGIPTNGSFGVGPLTIAAVQPDRSQFVAIIAQAVTTQDLFVF